MNLTSHDKLSLLKELYQLSTDTEVIPYIDSQTASRITNILETIDCHYEEF